MKKGTMLRGLMKRVRAEWDHFAGTHCLSMLNNAIAVNAMGTVNSLPRMTNVPKDTTDTMIGAITQSLQNIRR